MRVLVACEYTGVVREAFWARGHEAWSCDIRPAEDGSLRHYQGDVMDIINDGWDLMIAHPPCTHLASSGARWFKDKQEEQEDAVEFVRLLMSSPIPQICIENPIGVLSTLIRKPDQIVHPWMFGEPYRKSTCLWLDGLPLLQPTDIVGEGEVVIHGGKRIPKWYSNNKKMRDRTFQGMANAMAEQWG